MKTPAISLAALLLLPLAACGGSDQAGSSANSVPTATPTSSPTAEADTGVSLSEACDTLGRTMPANDDVQQLQEFAERLVELNDDAGTNDVVDLTYEVAQVWKQAIGAGSGAHDRGLTKARKIWMRYCASVSDAVPPKPQKPQWNLPKGYPRVVSVSTLPDQVRSWYEPTKRAVAVAPGVWAEMSPGATVEDAIIAGVFDGFCGSKTAFERRWLDGQETAGTCW